MTDHRLSLLFTSPRLAPGLLSRQAWHALESADAVLTRDVTEPQPHAIREAGVHVAPVDDSEPVALAATLMDRASAGHTIWVGAADGDPGLTEALAAEVARRRQGAPELEVLVGSWDTPGARLLDAVAVMDRLRSPGGCSWDAEQTHASLVPHLLEEAHEAVEALESGDREHMAEELGDVLLQVLFHARMAQEHEDDPFDIDDVAGALVAKLVRRHPHVFANADSNANTDAAMPDAAGVQATWDELKAVEQPHRVHPLDGIPAGMPELARAAKVAARLERVGRREWLADRVAAARPDNAVGSALMEVVLQARLDGIDPAAALRTLLRGVAEDLPQDRSQ